MKRIKVSPAKGMLVRKPSEEGRALYKENEQVNLTKQVMRYLKAGDLVKVEESEPTYIAFAKAEPKKNLKNKSENNFKNKTEENK